MRATSIPDGGSARRRRRAGVLGALLPFVAGCAVVGYPSPVTPSPGPRGEAAPRVTRASGPVVVADPSPRSVPAPEPSRSHGPLETYEVFGETYAILDSAEGYEEVGLASWYGREFAGRPTSSGEIFDPNGLTAAHRSLPLSTWVEVKNLENGKTVVLRVNDRGPFVDTDRRIIDVSYGAARLLGLIAPGTAQVEVRALPSDAGGSMTRR